MMEIEPCLLMGHLELNELECKLPGFIALAPQP